MSASRAFRYLTLCASPAAFSLLPVLFLVAACGSLDAADRAIAPLRPTPPDCKCTPVTRANLTTRFAASPRIYSGCAALRADVNVIRNRKHALAAESSGRSGRVAVAQNDKGPTASPIAKGTAPDVLGNLQEQGVDEADIYKVGAHHILALVDGKLHAADRATGRALPPLDLAARVEPHMFVHGDRLIVVDLVVDPTRSANQANQANQATKANQADNSPQMLLTSQALPDRSSPPPSEFRTRVRAVRLPAGAPPVVAEETFVSGLTRHLRLAQGKLILVSTTRLDDEEMGAMARDVGGVACTAIHAPAYHNLDESFTSVTLLDASDLRAPASATGFLGAGDHLYMTSRALYVGAQAASWDAYIPPEGEGAFGTLGSTREKLFLHRIGFDGAGGIGPVSLGVVPGRVKDVWAFKEIGARGEHLSIATTTGHLGGTGEDVASNHLTVLEREGPRLKKVGGLKGYGRNEDIRSVRYVNDAAYVVTFKKTDPLFAIDLSDPRNPRVRGELKIPGFSTYLHPVGEGRLVGLGFDTAERGDFALYQGVQFSLFDVSDMANPRRLDVKVHGQRGSSSEATFDHHAFFHDTEAGLVGFPIVELDDRNQLRTASGVPNSPPLFSGAVFYDITGDSLREVGRVSHAEWIPAPCRNAMSAGSWWENPAKAIDVARIFRVDGNLLTVSPYGVKAWADGVTTAATGLTSWGVKGCPAGMLGRPGVGTGGGWNRSPSFD